MPTARWLATLAFAASLAGPVLAQQPAVTPATSGGGLTPPVTPNTGLMSVERQADGRMTFRIYAPAAKAVTLVNETGVPVGFAKAEDGVFAGTSPNVFPPGPFRYTFYVDGVAVADPHATRFMDRREGVAAYGEVPEPTGGVQAFDPAIQHGAVSRVEYVSKALGVVRRMQVYTPPGYERGGVQRYPVLYLLHGTGDSDQSWSTIGRANLILDNLIASGRARAMIVVMPAGHVAHRGPPGPNAAAAEDFGRDLLGDVVPYVDAHYRTRPAADARAVAGLSMGGSHVLNNVGLPHPETFHYLGVFSSAVMEDPATYQARLGPQLARASHELKLFYYAIGKADPIFTADRVAATVDLLKKDGLKPVVRLSEGGHTWLNWRDYLADFVPRLFR